VDYLDNDGITDTPLPIRVALEIAGDRLALDFTGTAGATAGPVNISHGTAVAAVYVAIKHIFPACPPMPASCAPSTSPSRTPACWPREFPAPTGGYTETILRMIDVIFLRDGAGRAGPGGGQCLWHHQRAVARRAPGRRAALGDVQLLRRRPWRHPEGDGLNHGNAPISTATIPPVEILEAAYPVRFTQWALRPDSAGAGQHRGGLGAVYEIELLEDIPPRPSCLASAAAMRRRAWRAAARPR
jgi:N-methylhydantoinase B